MNKNKNSKTMLILSILLLLFIVIGAASAADDKLANETVSTTTNDGVEAISANADTVDDGASATDGNIIGASDAGNNTNENKLTASDDEYGSFTELSRLIKLSGDNVVLNKDYKYKTDDSSLKDTGIIITNPVYIHGNGHIINGSNLAKAFDIKADYVVLDNLTIVNTYTTTNGISWSGDYGKLLNSKFTNLKATTNNVNGGEGVFWSGNGATVENCHFYNMTTTSKHSDGLFCLKFTGFNVNVINTNFTNVHTPNSVTTRNVLFIDSSCVGKNIISGCHFTNITSQSTYQGYGFIVFLRAPADLIDCYFKDTYTRSSMIMTATGSSLIGCTFEDFGKITNFDSDYGNGAVVDGSLILMENCSFKNQKSLSKITPNFSTGNFGNIVGCNFTNTTVPSTVNHKVKKCVFDNIGSILSNVHDFEDCTFKNIDKQWEYVILFKGYYDNKMINCTFDNITTLETVINIDDSVDTPFINQSLTFKNIHSPNNITGTRGSVYESNEIIYVADTNLGDGLSSDKPTNNLTYALSICPVGGTIYIYNGTHTLTHTDEVTFKYNIKGKKDGNVILNLINRLVLDSGYTIENVTFNQTYALKIFANCKLNNLVFMNVAGNKIIDNIDKGWALFYSTATNCEFNNITIRDSDFNGNDVFNYKEGSGTRILTGLTVNKLTIDNCDNFGYIYDGWAMANCEFSNIEFTNSNINGVYVPEDSTKINAFSSFKHITVKNCNVSDSLIRTPSASFSQIDYSDITVEDVNFTASDDGIFIRAYGLQIFDNVKINNLRCTNKAYIIHLSDASGNVFKNSCLSNITGAKSVFIRTGNSEVNNVNLTDIDAFYGVNTVGTGSNLMNCKIENCTFSDSVMDLNDDSIVTECKFINVTGSVNITGNNVKISNSVFKSVESINGSICIEGINALINKCTFENNTGDYGGAICILNNASQITNSKFEGNKAKIHGGALFVNKNLFYYMDNVLSEESDNPVEDGVYRRGYVPNYNIIYVNSTRSVNEGNHVKDLITAFNLINPNGKIISEIDNDNFTINAGVPAFAKNNVTIIGKNTTVTLNGHLEISSYANNLTISNINFKNSPDGVFLWNAENGVLKNCQFNSNKMDLSDSYANLFGGVLIINANNMTIVDCNFTDNILDSFNSYGGAVYFNSTGLNVIGCIFDSNQAVYGSNIYITDESSDVLIKSSVFKHSKNFSNGGSAIWVSGKNVTISGSVFEFNTGLDYGAALRLDSLIGIVTVKGNNFTNNTVIYDGGAIYVSECPVLSIIGNNFTNNSADRDGGAIMSSASLSTSDNRFVNNSANRNGGALYLAGNGNELSNLVFINNTASDGGALYLAGNGNDLVDLLFMGNNASNGGAVYLASGKSMKLDNVNLTDNHNTTGYGVIYVDNGGSINIDGLKRDQTQTIYLVNYKSDVLYVNSSSLGDGNGLTPSDAAALTTELLTHLNDGGKVIFLNGVYNLSDVVEIYNKNIQFIGNASTIINKDKKSLFNNHLTHIKSCS